MQRFPWHRNKFFFYSSHLFGKVGSFPIFAILLVVLLLGGILNGGCSHLKTGKKKKDGLVPEAFSADLESGKTMLVGDYTTVGNYHPVQVQGFGLVRGLPGTGADDINSYERTQVYDEMQRMGVQNIRGILADRSTAVVNILGYLRPGMQEGDLFDVEIRLPPETEAKSLRGGWLMQAKLTEMAALGGNSLTGDTKAYVEGPIMVDDPLATETTNPAGLKQGVILSGARARDSRQIFLYMKSSAESAFITDRIAKEINHRFYVSTGQKKGMATAKTDKLIVLDMHPTYVNDVSRYIRVVQSIACYENPTKQIRRIERLKEELANPAKAQKAAFQLEAIGKAGIEPLRSVLDHKNSEVRFHAATALAYLGDGTPAKVLAEIARDEPAFRVYALDALSVMRNDIEAEMALQELLHVASAETRYGAFRALWTRNPYDRTIRGENLGNQFSYHGINSNGPPLVHITKSKRPEIVLFGSGIHLKQPFALDAGPTIVINGQQPGNVVVNKFALSGVDQRRTVPNKLDDIIRAVVDLGGTYPDIVQMLSQANLAQVLSCRMEVDCLPQSNRIYRRIGSDADDEEEEDIPKKKTAWERMNPKYWFETNPGGKTSDTYEPTNPSGRD